MRRTLLATVVALPLTVLSGCGDDSPPAASAPPPVEQRALSRQEQFLARIQQAAASNNVIRTARMNQDNELGVVLDSKVKPPEIKPLLTTLLREMRDEFPNRPLQVIAYAPTGQALASMRYDPAAPADANVTYRPNF